MRFDSDFEQLLHEIKSLIGGDPQRVPHVLAVILAGAPFRPVLERPEALEEVLAAARMVVEGRDGGK